MDSNKKIVSLLMVLALGLVTIQSISAQARKEPSTEYTADLTALSAQFNIDLPVLNGWVAQGYEPDQILLALEISVASGKSVDDSLILAANAGDNGWNAIAAALGLNPKSEEFRNLKKTWDQNEGKIFSDYQNNDNQGGNSDEEFENGQNDQGDRHDIENEESDGPNASNDHHDAGQSDVDQD